MILQMTILLAVFGLAAGGLGFTAACLIAASANADKHRDRPEREPEPRGFNPETIRDNVIMREAGCGK